MQGMNEVERARLRSEYEQLQKEYRNMEATRKAYAEESLSVIKKQKDTIEKLQKVNESLKVELDTELRFANRKVVLPGSAVHGLHDQLDLFMGKVELEKVHIDEVQTKIDETKATLVKESRMMGGVNAAKEAERLLERQVKVLDNRLEKALVRFNEALAANKEMRTTIDALRQERTVFEQVYKKLSRELGERKRAMAGLIETANQAYAGRDLAQMEAAKIQQECSAERLAFESRLADIDREADETVARLLAETDDLRGTLTMEEEASLKQSLKDHQRELAEMVSQARAHAGKVEFYELAFNRIRDESGIEEVEELVQVFARNEDANFSLFSFVSSQQGEISKLEESQDKLKSQALSYEAGRLLLGEAKADNAATAGGTGSMPVGSGAAAARAAAGASGAAGEASVTSYRKAGAGAAQAAAAQQLAAIQGAVERMQERVDVQRGRVEEARQAVDSVLRLTAADRLQGAQLALTDGAVTEGNLLPVLALLEQRTQALVLGYAAYEKLQRAAAAAAAAITGLAVADDVWGQGVGPVTPSAAPPAPPPVQEVPLYQPGTGAAYPSTGSPERAAAITMMGPGPGTRPGAAERFLRPPVPAISDFVEEDDDSQASRDGGAPARDRAALAALPAGASSAGLLEEDDEDNPTRPLPLAEIKRQALERLAEAGLS